MENLFPHGGKNGGRGGGGREAGSGAGMAMVAGGGDPDAFHPQTFDCQTGLGGALCAFVFRRPHRLEA